MMTIVDPEQFTNKDKPIIYIEAFVELYNMKNCRQVYKIHKIVEFEKIYALTAKHSHNLSAYYLIKISSILRSEYIICKN